MGNAISVGPRALTTMVFLDVKGTARSVTKSASRRSLSSRKGNSRLLPRVWKNTIVLRERVLLDGFSCNVGLRMLLGGQQRLWRSAGGLPPECQNK